MGGPGVLRIVGAGPAGLTAAIVGCKAGRKVVVYERYRDVGGRFHGDFQGLENWSSTSDVLEQLRVLGIEPTFRAVPICEQVCFGPDGHEYFFRSPRPFYYLISRGSGPGTLDTSLKEQALAAGAEIRFRESVRNPSADAIISWGPRRADALAVGYLFETDLPDGGFAVLDDRLAPKGYGYLLVHGCRATLATCLFHDFTNQAVYLERTVAFFCKKLRISMGRPQRFGGVGNIHLSQPSALGQVSWAGEAAGIQDPLWGFGIRYAILSGAITAGIGLDADPRSEGRLWEEAIGRYLRAGFVNRYFYDRMGRLGYLWLLRCLSRSRDPRRYLQYLYAPSWWKLAMFPLLSGSFANRRAESNAKCFDISGAEEEKTWRDRSTLAQAPGKQ